MKEVVRIFVRRSQCPQTFQFLIGNMYFWAWNNLLYICIPRNQKTVVFRLLPVSALIVTTHVRGTKILDTTVESENSYLFFINKRNYELLRVPVNLVITCLRLSWLEKGNLTDLISCKNYLYIFCSQHHFEGIKEEQKQHLARTMRYQLLLITPSSPLNCLLC